MKAIHNRIVKQIKRYFEQNNFTNAVIGLSGGIDSSLSAKLVVDAIGKENVVGLIMPENGISSKASIEHAKLMIDVLGIRYKEIFINKYLDQFKILPWKQNKNAKMNIKARIRSVLLYNYANTHDAIVIGTSNTSELMLGYFTKYGDGGIDLEVIGDLYKTEVFELSRYLNLPKEIIDKEPSAELYKGHTDEKELGATYEKVDKILIKISAGKRPNTKLAKEIIKRIDANKHKTVMPYVIRGKR